MQHDVAWWLGVAAFLAICGGFILTDLPFPVGMEKDAERRVMRSLAIRFACAMAIYTLGLVTCAK